MRKIKNKFFWLSLLILFVALFFPSYSIETGPSYDKLAHVILFTFVSINTIFYFSKNTKQLLLIFGIIGLLPILTELIQTLIPGRAYDTYDIFADYIGLVLGVIIFILLKNKLIWIYQLLGDQYIPNPGEFKFL